MVATVLDLLQWAAMTAPLSAIVLGILDGVRDARLTP